MTNRVSEAWDFGATVRGYKWTSHSPRGSLLLQHGYAEYAERYIDGYRRLIPSLVDLGLDVYAFDLPGHGRSSGVRGAVDVEQAVLDHLAARQALESRGIPLFLLGHSLGGLITAGSALRSQQHISGVILTSPALLLGASLGQRLFVKALASIAPTRGVIPPQSASGISRDADAVALFERDPSVYRGNMPAITGKSALAVSEANWRGCRQWRLPSLLIHGGDDTYTNPKGSILFNALIASPDKTIHLYEKGRHELLNDLDRDVVWREISKWIQQRLD